MVPICYLSKYFFSKFEIRNTKSETNPKFKNSNVQNNSRRLHYQSHTPVWIISIFVIQICFEFRYSNFGFIFYIPTSDASFSRSILLNTSHYVAVKIWPQRHESLPWSAKSAAHSHTPACPPFSLCRSRQPPLWRYLLLRRPA